jgi:hypothetical protein
MQVRTELQMVDPSESWDFLAWISDQRKLEFYEKAAALCLAVRGTSILGGCGGWWVVGAARPPESGGGALPGCRRWPGAAVLPRVAAGRTALTASPLLV